MLMTAQEVKTILRITDTTYDDDIAAFLPLVEQDLISELNNAFQDGYVYRESGSDLAFHKGDSSTYDYITDADEKFLARGFDDGMDIIVEGGWSNVGLYTIDSASSGTLKLDEYGVLINQDQSSTQDDHAIGAVRISRVDWPRAIKIPAAKMVWHLIKNAQGGDEQSESIGGYSVTYFGTHAYPIRVIRMLDRWRQIRMW